MKQDDRLPDFLIVGAMRSGTTTLFRLLAAHPEIGGAPGKEIRFFDLHFDRGLDWYQGRFSPVAGCRLIGEASQTYMYDPVASKRLLALLPHAKLIAILRDPVDRAYSHYWLNKARGREPLDFSHALGEESARIGRDPISRYLYSYVDRGRYHVQLQRLSDPLDDAHLHVVLFDDLRDDPAATYRELCRFLHVDDSFVPGLLGERINAYQEVRSLRLRRLTKTLKRRGTTVAKRASGLLGALNRRRTFYPPMSSDIRDRLAKVFREDNLALARWLGRDLHWTGFTESRVSR
jgi:hypothetical protein